MTVTIPPSPLNNDDVAQLYKQWDGINSFVGNHREILRNHYSSSTHGNYCRNIPTSITHIAVNESHQALLNVMYGLGNLFKPVKIDGPASETHAAIQNQIEQHVLHVKKLKIIYENKFGKDSAQLQKPGASHIDKSDQFGSLDDLKHILYKTHDRDLQRTMEGIYDDISSNSIQTDELLSTFSQQLLQLPKLTLQNTQGDELVIPNRKIVTPAGSEVVSLGYVLYLLKKQSQNDIDDTARPESIQKKAHNLFSQDSTVYNSIKHVLLGFDLDNQPIIVREFETERDSLTQRIAYHTHHYDTFMDEYPLHPHNSMYRLLGLDQSDTFENAKEAYIARLNAEKPAPEPRKKPIIKPGGKCPFGHG